MRTEKFFCKGCNRLFDKPRIYNEMHMLDSPPYERVAVCPICGSDDFLKSERKIEKTEVAEKILPAVMYFNRYVDALTDVFGPNIKNGDYDNGVTLLVELIGEMFDFMDVSAQRKIFEMNNNSDVDRILIYLKGGI